VRSRRAPRRVEVGEERVSAGNDGEGRLLRRARSSAAMPSAAREAMAGAPRICEERDIDRTSAVGVGRSGGEAVGGWQGGAEEGGAGEEEGERAGSALASGQHERDGERTFIVLMASNAPLIVSTVSQRTV